MQLINEKVPSNLPNGLHYPKDSDNILSFNNNNSNLKRHALTTNLAGQTNQTNHVEENNIGELAITPSKQRRLNNDAINTKNSQLIVNNNNDLINQKVLTNSLEELNKTTSPGAALTQPNDFNCLKQTTMSLTSHQRARKQKHEHLLPIAMEEVIESSQTNSNDSFELPAESNSNDRSS